MARNPMPFRVLYLVSGDNHAGGRCLRVNEPESGEYIAIVEETPTRSLTFLRGIAKYPHIQAQQQGGRRRSGGPVEADVARRALRRAADAQNGKTRRFETVKGESPRPSQRRHSTAFLFATF